MTAAMFNVPDIVGWLMALIVTCWAKAPNLAHIYFGPKQNFLEGVPDFKGQGQGQFKIKC